MLSFLEEVVNEISQEYDSLENIIFILPSKRAGTFLKNSIAEKAIATHFSPDIYSIESFIEEISGLTYATNTQQLFELYDTYLKNTSIEKDSFFAFSKWGQTLLQDFNEIDRYLIETSSLFSNLAAIQEINHWSVQDEKTQMMQDYLSFWNNLDQLYTDFNAALLQQGLGHQGLVYRTACERLSQYLICTQNSKHCFIGFNALNTAESHIIQTILTSSEADIYWDIDASFLNDPIHDAGLFIRNHQKKWPFFKDKLLKGVTTNFSAQKNIQITGVPKNVTQAKYVGNLLATLQEQHPESIKNTAVVLGDENLLNPILNSVPEQIETVNITMGYPLNKTALASLFLQFIELYIYRDKRGWFYQNILAFLSHPYIQELLNATDSNDKTDLTSAIIRNNWTFITTGKIETVSSGSSNLPLLFFDSHPTPQQFVRKCLKIINELRIKFHKKENTLAIEYLYRFHELFNQVLGHLEQHSFINDLKSLQSLYKELLSSESVDFQGDPLEGLQIMGMLESRNLDFETVIITSVNEGILPSGKSNNSFIPFDLKKALGLPTYKEKDAVYTYHFYRLLQRAKNIHIIYNTEPDVLEGRERSRLISQLLTDPQKEKEISSKVVAPSISPTIKNPQQIEKQDGLIALIAAHANSGFSPTSLSNYIRNPIDFYKKTLLGIQDSQEVEENVAANTFGTIVHDTLEELYTPFIGTYLTTKGLKSIREQIPSLVKKHFSNSYMEGEYQHGKNLIAYHVIVKYIENFIDQEILEVENHQIKIIGLEEKLNTTLNIPEIAFPIRLKGKLDRIDEKDGILRIIDYKTGKVERKHVEIVDWEEITSEYEYSKAFQLLCYATMYNDKRPIETIESGIISFKNLQSGFLKFATKEKRTSRNKETRVTQETLSVFSNELKKLILEICNPDIPFLEKEA